MTETEDIKQVVRILSKVPAKSLRILELINEIPVIHGDLDINVLEKMGSEVEEAKKEAEVYKHATGSARDAISRLIGKDAWEE